MSSATMIPNDMIEVDYSYTPIRRFYARVGFTVLCTAIISLLAFAVWGTVYVDRNLAFARADALETEQRAEVRGVITAYSSTREQTDDTPFETASGQRVRAGIVANNCLPFGTEVTIGEKRYEVQDRMNSRYGCDRYDVWMESTEAAIEWGVQEHRVIVAGI